MSILICNAGSSTLKFSVFGNKGENQIVQGEIDWGKAPAVLKLNYEGLPETRRELYEQDENSAVETMLDELLSGKVSLDINNLLAVGHRVVHGGRNFSSAVRISTEVKRSIAELSALAPLHNSPSLAVIEAMEKNMPGVFQVAAFDTAFHASLSPAAYTYALPHHWTHDLHIRRYGFHGLSHAYCAERAEELIGQPNQRLVIAHLGNGASLSAVHNLKCVDTTMGFTPMEGLMMGTRSGSVDPGILIYLLRQHGISVEELDHALNHESGLLGVSGISSDMRSVLAAQSSNPNSRLAVDMFVHSVIKSVGAMAATLGGIDGLVFTAGIGERSAEIRARVCSSLTHLGLELDRSANEEAELDCDIATKHSNARILIIRTREDKTILRETRRLLMEK